MPEGRRQGAGSQVDRGGRRWATLLLTDVEGSSRAWQRRRVGMRSALARHDEVVAGLGAANRGVVLTSHGEGDSFFIAFDAAPNALEAAAAIQTVLAGEEWPRGARLRVRMAVHSGEVEADYRGPPANRCARLRDCGHGGQVLVSSVTAQLVFGQLPAGASLRDLGEHRLRDHPQPERIHQLVIPGLRSRFPPLRSWAAFAHNLPSQLSSFVGRAAEIAEVKRLVAAGRLVTLVGAGGCGKTRLALKVSSELLPRFPGGVWLVDLAPTHPGADLPQVVADALAWRDRRNPDPVRTLADRFARARTLLVLDNCEHLADATAALAWSLLRASPGLRILVTSREALNITGELAWQVPSLSAPGPGTEAATANLQQFEALALFVDRATGARPGIKLDDRAAGHIARICRRLDGIPLAIELAAARARSMSLSDLARRIEEGVLLDQRAPAWGGGRHRTLRAAIDWSYNLLSAAEQVLLRRLAVFAGGWRLESAETVCGTPPLDRPSVADRLDQLVSKSLIQVSDEHGSLRYRMLETIRQYGLELLEGENQLHEMRARHLADFLELAERAEDLLWSAGQAAFERRLDVDADNIRSALAWSRDAAPEKFVRLCSAMAPFWIAHQRLAEGRQWLSAAIERETGETPLRATALRRLGGVAFHQRDYQTAEVAWRESLRLIEKEGGDPEARCRILNNLGLLAYNQLRFEDAERLYSEAMSALGSSTPQHQAMVAVVLQHVGLSKTETGKLDEGWILIEDALALFRSRGNHGLISAGLSSLAINAIYRDERELARSAAVESLALATQVDDGVQVCTSLECLALLAAVDGQFERAIRLVGAVDAVRASTGTPAYAVTERRLNRWLAPAREALGGPGAERLRREGMQMSIEEAVEYGSDAGAELPRR